MNADKSEYIIYVFDSTLHLNGTFRINKAPFKKRREDIVYLSKFNEDILLFTVLRDRSSHTINVYAYYVNENQSYPPENRISIGSYTVDNTGNYYVDLKVSKNENYLACLISPKDGFINNNLKIYVLDKSLQTVHESTLQNKIDTDDFYWNVKWTIDDYGNLITYGFNFPKRFKKVLSIDGSSQEVYDRILPPVIKKLRDEIHDCYITVISVWNNSTNSYRINDLGVNVKELVFTSTSKTKIECAGTFTNQSNLQPNGLFQFTIDYHNGLSKPTLHSGENTVSIVLDKKKEKYVDSWDSLLLNIRLQDILINTNSELLIIGDKRFKKYRENTDEVNPEPELLHRNICVFKISNTGEMDDIFEIDRSVDYIPPFVYGFIRQHYTYFLNGNDLHIFYYSLTPPFWMPETDENGTFPYTYTSEINCSKVCEPENYHLDRNWYGVDFRDIKMIQENKYLFYTHNVGAFHRFGYLSFK